MCILKNGVGVILANGEKLVVVNGMLTNQNICINANLYDGHKNKVNHYLNIVKVYRHLSDKWNDGCNYGIMEDIESSELLFDYDKYVIKLIDCSSSYYIGDNEIVYSTLEEAEKEYEKIVERTTNILLDKRWLNVKTPIFKCEQLNFKATMFGDSEASIEKEDVIFPIKIIMKKY